MQRGTTCPRRGCFVSPLMASTGWGPLPGILPGWAEQTPTPPGSPWPSHTPGDCGLGRKQPGFPASPQSPPSQAPMINPGCPCPEPPREDGDVGAKLERSGLPAAPEQQSPPARPPPVHPTGGQTPAASKLTLARGRTMKAPPPPDSTMMARNLGLTAQKELSHVTLETRMSSYIWSAFTGCPKTCRNLLWRTTRRLMAGGAQGQAATPPRHSMEGFWPPQASERPPFPTPGTGGSLGTRGWQGMRVQDGAQRGGTGGSPGAGGVGAASAGDQHPVAGAACWAGTRSCHDVRPCHAPRLCRAPQPCRAPRLAPGLAHEQPQWRSRAEGSLGWAWRCHAPGHSLSPCVLMSPAQPSTHKGGCASSIAHPRPLHEAPRVPLTPHPQPTRLARTPGEGWTPGCGGAPHAQHGPSRVSSPRPQPGMLPAITHLHPKPVQLLGPAWGH